LQRILHRKAYINFGALWLNNTAYSPKKPLSDPKNGFCNGKLKKYSFFIAKKAFFFDKAVAGR